MIDNASTQLHAGAINLLKDCVGAKYGQRILIVREPNDANYYDQNVTEITASVGRRLGLTVYETVSDHLLTKDYDNDHLVNTLSGFDHVVFFSRIGDQIRFSSTLGIPSSTMCYTLDGQALTSTFGAASYKGMGEIKTVLDNAFHWAEDIIVTCPRGTHYRGKPVWQSNGQDDVSIKRFPVLIGKPIPANGFSGRVALSRFITSTGSRCYEPSSLELPSDITANFKNNKICFFEGQDADVEMLENHYRRVAELFDIDPWYIDSWHAGIHPACHFDNFAKNDLLRWSGSAFGNPRILHFHTCGKYAPGEISWYVLDPTVTLDGVALWENGRLYPERLPEGKALLDRHPELAKLFKQPATDIGLDHPLHGSE